VVIRSRDLAGNIGASVPIGRDGLPAIGYGEGAPGHGGITVRYVGVQAPGAPVAAGGIAEFYVDARRAAYTWGLRRAGGPPGSIRRGRGTRVRLRIHVPKGAAGVYLLTVRTARRQVRVPVAFGGRRPAGGTPAAPRGVLVVLPVMTWQGRNAVDDDGDGVPDTLSAGRPIRAARVLAGDGLPAGFATHEAPLLAFLDRRHRRYDITTDLALAAGAGPRLAAYRGVLLPGDTRWLPPAVGRALRGFARSGKTIVSVGTGSLRRLVHLTPGGRLVQPSVAAPTDLFGAHIVGLARGPVTLTNLRDQIGLFVGTTGLFTGVDPYEGTTGVGSQARLVASAVTPSGRAVIVAARFGKGLVIRTGMPSLATRLRSDPALATMTGRLWTLLSR
jgi:putative intracellular protease/amidase